MIINLLADYRGVLTDENFYPAGKYQAPEGMPDDHAVALLEAGRAEDVSWKSRKARPKPARRRVGRTLATKKK